MSALLLTHIALRHTICTNCARAFLTALLTCSPLFPGRAVAQQTTPASRRAAMANADKSQVVQGRVTEGGRPVRGMKIRATVIFTIYSTRPHKVKMAKSGKIHTTYFPTWKYHYYFATTDHNGNYTLRLPAHSSCLIGTPSMPTDRGYPINTTTATLDILLPEKNHPNDFLRWNSVSGTILSAEGAPVAGAFIVVDGACETVSDKQGHFQIGSHSPFYLHPDECRALVVAPGHGITVVPIPLIRPVAVNIRLERPSKVTVHLTDEQGRPLPNQTISCYRIEDQAGTLCTLGYFRFGWHYKHPKTDANGDAYFDYLPQGKRVSFSFSDAVHRIDAVSHFTLTVPLRSEKAR